MLVGGLSSREQVRDLRITGNPKCGAGSVIKKGDEALVNRVDERG
ncbi:MAG: hypothetical protein WC655_08520 [Candidatus Hydrogenedentales bacterium]|jgi:hypothetical protein